MTHPVLSIEGLHKRYASLEILKDINVSMAPGDFLVLVGPSGCGKSTLLNCIAGLEEVTSGAVHIAGRDMTGAPPRERDIAMVFQSYALYPTMTVAKNITFGMKVRGVDGATRRKKLNEIAELLQIESLLDRKPGQLSGGQRQRVAMGRALVRSPRLFLFDEPLSNLDAKLRVGMRTEIKKLHHTLNASIVYVTHDQIEAMTLATRIVVMKAGVIQQIGAPSQIYNQPANLFVADFMGSPSMNLIPATARALESGMNLRIERPDDAPLDLRDDHMLPGMKTGDERAVILGMRPENITDPSAREDAPARVSRCRVEVVEPVGSETYVVTRLGGKEVIARMHADTDAQPGKIMECAFDLSKASYFDPSGGARLN